MQWSVILCFVYNLGSRMTKTQQKKNSYKTYNDIYEGCSEIIAFTFNRHPRHRIVDSILGSHRLHRYHFSYVHILKFAKWAVLILYRVYIVFINFVDVTVSLILYFYCFLPLYFIVASRQCYVSIVTSTVHSALKIARSDWSQISWTRLKRWICLVWIYN